MIAVHWFLFRMEANLKVCFHLDSTQTNTGVNPRQLIYQFNILQEIFLYAYSKTLNNTYSLNCCDES